MQIKDVVADDKNPFEFEHKDWATATIKVDDSTTVFRALTYEIDENGFTAFIMDRGSIECSSLYLQIVRTSITPHGIQNAPTGMQFGKNRIDEMPARNINYEIEVRDKNSMNITIVNFDREDSFYDELRNGKRLRFKLTGVDGKPVYLGFSLAGSAAAMLKTAELCDQKTDDKEFFNDPKDPLWSVNPNDDSTYF